MKTIAIIDNSDGGHRLYHMQQFVKAISSLNYKVVCIFPNVNEVNTWMQKNEPLLNKNNIYVEYNIELKPVTLFFSYINDVLTALNFWISYKTVLKKIEKQHHLKIDLFFLNNVDVFLSCFLHPKIHRLFFSYKWSGFYIHTRYMRMYKDIEKRKTRLSDIDYLFTGKNCTGVAVADEGIAKGMQYRIDKKVIALPDFTDTILPIENPTLVAEIKTKANGRIIIGMIGLETHKGIIDMARLAIKADSSLYYFVFCGYYDETYLAYCENDEERDFFVSFQNNLPENCLWNIRYLKDEQEYNAIFNTFDIIYMVYKNHYTSSNRLTKAAVFHKLVLAQNVHCVGENVTKYNLGETAMSGNIEEQLQQLEKLRNRLMENDFPTEQWKIYAEKNNEKMLPQKLAEIINL